MSGANFRLTRWAISPRRKLLVALERREHRLAVAAAERHDVDGGEPQVGRHAHLRHGDEMGLEHRIVHVAARQDLGEGVADELADAQARAATGRCRTRDGVRVA